jgi:cellulose synthase/poly-beta-1,6-N-acetylglucosamine synthase-like glycosyltransferase
MDSRFTIFRGFRPQGRRRKLALVIAAHNEELFLRSTIRTAIEAGQLARDIYVVDDGSRDQTRQIAVAELGADNVLSQWQVGKSTALKNIVERKSLTSRYEWVHFADADTHFGPNYFTLIRRKLDPAYAAVTGYIKSLPGPKTSQYRVYEYTWGMEVVRRFQSLFGLILVIPGPSACYRSDVLEQIEFESGTLTEDFDMTLQLFRERLGAIRYVPEAKVFTQDPRDLKDYTKQIRRWYRGIFQVARLRRLGLRGRKEDWYFAYQVAQTILSFLLVVIGGPLSIAVTGSFVFLSWLFLTDIMYMIASVFLSGLAARQTEILSNFPHFYLMRWVSAGVFMRAFIEVIVLHRFAPKPTSWSTQGRRYQIATS